MLSKNQWKYPAWNRLPAGKGSKDDQGFISSVTPGLTGKGICGSLLGRCSACPVNSTCFSPGEMNSRAVQHFWLESKGKKREPAVGAIRKERKAFPFFQLNPRVKDETQSTVCVLCVPRAHSRCRRPEPAPLKASPDTLNGTFSLRFQGFLSRSCSSILIPSTRDRWSTRRSREGTEPPPWCRWQRHFQSYKQCHCHSSWNGTAISTGLPTAGLGRALTHLGSPSIGMKLIPEGWIKVGLQYLSLQQSPRPPNPQIPAEIADASRPPCLGQEEAESSWRCWEQTSQAVLVCLWEELYFTVSSTGCVWVGRMCSPQTARLWGGGAPCAALQVRS